jgi:hypothetical protein
MRYVRHVACMGWIRNIYKILIGTPKGKTPLVRCRHRWENNINMKFEGVHWIDLLQDRVQSLL